MRLFRQLQCRTWVVGDLLFTQKPGEELAHCGQAVGLSANAKPPWFLGFFLFSRWLVAIVALEVVERDLILLQLVQAWLVALNTSKTDATRPWLSLSLASGA